MNLDQAREMAKAFNAMEVFKRVRVDHHGHVDQCSETNANDGLWFVELWSTNAAAGNVNIHAVRDYTADAGQLAKIVTQAKAAAKKANTGSARRIAAERNG